MDMQEIISWLLEGDTAIQYQTYRDLLNDDKPELQARIAKTGWGHRYLSLRNESGHWGRGFYQPKWTSSHYTLLDLRNLCIAPDLPEVRSTADLIADLEKAQDGGVDPAKTKRHSDVCVNGMFLNYASYFGIAEEKLHSVVDFILDQKMPDGGFNCRKNQSGARHSSLHSTLSVAEGIAEYHKQGYTYRLRALCAAEQTSRAFMLLHQLYISDRTGEIINPRFLRIPYPTRWYYDILRALDYMQYVEMPYDKRMQPAIDVIKKKRRKDGRWTVQAKYPGKIHFEMESAGKPSRMNTLRALRVLKYFEKQEAEHAQ